MGFGSIAESVIRARPWQCFQFLHVVQVCIDSNQAAFAIIDNCQMNNIGIRPTFKKKNWVIFFIWFTKWHPNTPSPFWVVNFCTCLCFILKSPNTMLARRNTSIWFRCSFKPSWLIVWGIINSNSEVEMDGDYYNSRPITSRCITRSNDLRVFGPTKFAVLILVVKDKSVLSLPGGGIDDSYCIFIISSLRSPSTLNK